MRIGVGAGIEEFKDSSDLKEFELINLENPLYPNYLEGDIKKDLQFINSLKGYRYIIDGAYIDLNPGSSETKIKEITREKVIESIDYAIQMKAEEVIFLSTFLPFIKVDFYERSWLEESKEFWKEIIDQYQEIRISLCNTFEFNPDYLIEIVETVDRDNFGLSLDLGHAILWGKISLIDWYKRVASYLTTVYIHSNDGTGDQHLSFLEANLQSEELKFKELIRLLRAKDYNLILKYFNKEQVLKDKRELEALMKNY